MSHNWIRTYTGRQFYPLDPSFVDVRIEDIAHALSNLCRFTGHVTEFYSVAEHSVRVARRLFDVTFHLSDDDRRQAVLEALLHDASEAYLNDLATPVKYQSALDGYRAAEAKVQTEVFKKFGVEPHFQALVKHADEQLLATEARDLLPDGGGWEPAVPPLHGKIVPWTPAEAKREFLWMFTRVFDGDTRCDECGLPLDGNGKAVVRAEFMQEPKGCWGCGSCTGL